MRTVIWGAGAVGGTLAAGLARSGHSVLLVARGAHLDCLRRPGLRWQTPSVDEFLPIPATDDPGRLTPEDVVVIAVKTQDTAGVMERLRDEADPSVPVVCAQNAVENERSALRHFDCVYGMAVHMPAEHLVPGVVRLYAEPSEVRLDIGRYPRGSDATCETIVGALTQAGFGAHVAGDIVTIKYQKLLSNLGNAANVVCAADDPDLARLVQLARTEAERCYAAAGIQVRQEPQTPPGTAGAIPPRSIGGRRHAGSSTWQSLARQARRSEIDYLNGEIVLLGRMHGVPTPVNAALQAAAARRFADGPAGGPTRAADLLDGVTGQRTPLA